jgi:hypothetical protein
MLTGFPPSVSTSSSICLPLLARIERRSSSEAASQALLLLPLSSLAPVLLLPLLLALLAHLKDVNAERYLQTPCVPSNVSKEQTLRTFSAIQCHMTFI